MTEDRNFSFIVVEGPIGVGKTSLAKRLADTYQGDYLLEKAYENPFLERFYHDHKGAALPTQLFFLFQRAKQIQELRQSDMFKPIRIADFLIDKDRLFASLILNSDELRLYDQVYNSMTLDAPIPDLVIYLQAPVEVLLNRIRKRGVTYEKLIESDYLQMIIDGYANFFYHYISSPLLIINATEIDLVDNDADYQQLLNRINTVHSGRHYFNPIPIEL